MGAKLLLVEDDPDSAEAMTIFLKWEGYEVQWANTGRAALDVLTMDGTGGPGPDVVLLDLRLPDMSGVELAGELFRRRPAAPPIVLLSAMPEGQLETRRAHLGAASRSSSNSHCTRDQARRRLEEPDPDAEQDLAVRS